MRRLELTDREFGDLTVLAPAGLSKRGALLWRCSCVCGNIVEIDGSALKRGREHCGCRASEKHGLTGTPIYRIWGAMKERCENPHNEAWPRYGGRGIKVCERWQSFKAFHEDMGDPPNGLTLERDDNDGDYEPDNCRWATRTEQARNRRSNRPVTVRGTTRLLSDWAHITGVKRLTLRARLERGWSDEDAVLTPTGQPKGRRSDAAH